MSLKTRKQVLNTATYILHVKCNFEFLDIIQLQAEVRLVSSFNNIIFEREII